MANVLEPDKTVNTIENIAFLEEVSSLEYFFCEGKEPRRVLKAVNLLVKNKEAWGINARSQLEIGLLLEIIANVRSYAEGKCVLIERGMVRHKRIILPHVFYIGGSEMPYDNMNVLEYLMFAMGRMKMGSYVELQENLLEFVVDAGLGHIVLTPVSILEREEKAVVTLIVAAYSKCLLTVFNLPGYQFDDVLTEAIARLSAFMRGRGKALIIGTRDCRLIEKTCSHTAFIADGELIYRGTTENLRLTYDKVIVILRDKDIYYLLDSLAPLLPEYRLNVKDGCLLIGAGETGEAGNPGHVYRKIIEAGFVPQKIEINPKTVFNAYEELVLQHDLQNGIL